MRYRRFIIENYRAISLPIEIDVTRNTLMPIIGVNECGKTTILHAIFAFDRANDALNDGGRHLKDTQNLYDVASVPGRVAADVEIDPDEFSDCVNAVYDDESTDDDLRVPLRAYRRKRRKLPNVLRIVRDLQTKRYSIECPMLDDPDANDAVAQEIILGLPYILYFDDFRDSIDERVEIVPGDPTGWLAILEQLFRRTDPAFSVFMLSALEERRRRSVLSKVESHLNKTLTKEWRNLRLEDDEALEISLSFETTDDANSTKARRHFLKLDVVEKSANGDLHFFYVRDRSKGFFWFFNFVMKLEFNPKVVEGSKDGTIYLLDEPGSYLHALAQQRLCAKLRKLSDGNRVIYCTHSHYLLDPELIPLTTVHVAEKDGNGNVQLVRLLEHKTTLERRSAFQPIVDALEIKPFLLDMSHDNVVVVEGMKDYYAFEMMKDGRSLNVLPSVGADSITYLVSLLIAWRVHFVALWDDDKQGRQAHQRATAKFGDEFAKRHFFLLERERGRGDCKLEDLFDGSDIRMAKEKLGIPQPASFDKTIAAIFYSPRRSEVVAGFSHKTRAAFARVLDSLTFA